MADEVAEDRGSIGGCLLGRILDDLLKGENATDPNVDLGRAQPFNGFGETFGDLAASGEPVGPGGVEQGDAGTESSNNRDQSGTQACDERCRSVTESLAIDVLGIKDIRTAPDEPGEADHKCEASHHRQGDQPTSPKTVGSPDSLPVTGERGTCPQSAPSPPATVPSPLGQGDPPLDQVRQQVHAW
ncbi:hypothetical protein ACFWBH_01385 [Streptomyces sp. NPDC059999]|uniref:hypothetical protein n=1 Tax=Streptomyces sp. NPDC059999 TaxID=3347030 RepID=UPI003699A95F